MTFLLVEPEGRQKSWRVHAYNRGHKVATWTCDSEEIARFVAKRLRRGKLPGWAAHDLRQGKKEYL